MAAVEFDYILVGGGLQNGLITLALRSDRPQARIALIEKASRLGGNHTWCFHSRDLAPRALMWIEPLVCYRWPGYDVVFPGLSREITGTYSAIKSERFHDVVSSAVEGMNESRLHLDTTVERVDANAVQLLDGRSLSARVVIDSRGPQPSSANTGANGYQKFLGLELALKRPHNLEQPVVMDATVDQSDGFRFFYTLPFGPDRVLVEDTYFHHSPKLNRERLRREVIGYARAKGYEIKDVIREEVGVLPMPWSGSLPSQRLDPLAGGYRGGWFHPATGYSLPVAARLAERVAGESPDSLSCGTVAQLARQLSVQARYCHILNYFLFCWYAPSMRWHIFKRFYKLPQTTIDRFYALRMTWPDRFRLLVGRPPQGFSLRYRMRRRAQS